MFMPILFLESWHILSSPNDIEIDNVLELVAIVFG